jgi:dTDP-4-amino-4,6-dideoxygalactose transaminase
MSRLKEKGIGSAVYYPIPMHLQECYLYLGYIKENLPNSVCAAQQALSLPMYPELTYNMQMHVVEQLTSILHGTY